MKIKKHVQDLKGKGHVFHPVTAFRTKRRSGKGVKSYDVLDMSSVRRKMSQEVPDHLALRVGEYNCLLYRVHHSPVVLTDKGPHKGENIVDYRGIVEGEEASLVSITISSHEVAGFISVGDKTLVLGKSQDEQVLYDKSDLEDKNPFACEYLQATNVPEGFTESIVDLTPIPETAELTTKCVKWYWEIDYNVYQNKGSVDAVNTWIRAVFNQVSTLYANDGIAISLKTLFIWSSPSPYTGPSTGNYLTQFGSYRTTWDGDLAHLIGFAGNGGVAYVNGIQMCEYGSGQVTAMKGYSGVSPYYNTVPTYSWTVECITHEMGHQLGSNHTHDCVWNGNGTKIDDCGGAVGYSGGSCPPQPDPVLPVGGGTIMSYCHLTSVGINFSKGFGPQPAALITNKVNNSSCLGTCDGTPPCNVPGMTTTINGSVACVGTYVTYSTPAISGATSYLWTIPTGWSGSSTTSSITLLVGSSSGTLTVRGVNSCGSGLPFSAPVTVYTIPTTPGVITGSTTVTQGVSTTYSIAAVVGANSYIWTLPSGWSGSSTSTSINVIPSSTSGTISVRASNFCGQSPSRTLNVSVITTTTTTTLTPTTTTTTTATPTTTTTTTPATTTTTTTSGTTTTTTIPATTTTTTTSGTTTTTTTPATTTTTTTSGTTTTTTTLCANPRIIVCSIRKRQNDVYVDRSGYTNYKYAWEKKAFGSSTFVKQTWNQQIVHKSHYSVGDTLRVTVTSTNAQTPTSCYKGCISSITI